MGIGTFAGGAPAVSAGEKKGPHAVSDVQASTGVAVRARPVRRSQWQRARRSLRHHWQLYLLMVVPLIYFVVFKYIPMSNAVIAFKDYNVVQGIWGSPWVGFRNFQLFFDNPVFWTLLRNTFQLSLYAVVASFPIPIILALALNEVRRGACSSARSSWSPTRRTSSPRSSSSR